MVAAHVGTLLVGAGYVAVSRPAAGGGRGGAAGGGAARRPGDVGSAGSIRLLDIAAAPTAASPGEVEAVGPDELAYVIFTLGVDRSARLGSTSAFAT